MRLGRTTAGSRGSAQRPAKPARVRPPKRARVRPPRLHQPSVHLSAMMAGAALVAAFAAAAPALHGSFVGNRTPSQPAAVVAPAAGGTNGAAPADGPGTYTTFVTPPSATVTTGPGTIATVLYTGPSAAGEGASPLAADGIPVTALEAYQNAANMADAADPSCHLPWPLLAGIGRVESDHGRYGGAVLRPDGSSTKPIIGPPLDGNGTEVVLDTDNGKLDGDPVYDRAVGPMQFIPSTWAIYGTDGNSDGIADPFNIFDAAAAAAHYLCVAGGDLSTTAGQTRAVLSYNHSVAYLDEVLALERTYASGEPGLIIPQPPVSAPTLPVTTPGKPVPPPVNPGPPLSAGPGPKPGPGSSSSSSPHPSPSGTSSRPAGGPTSSSSPSSPSSSPSSSAAPTSGAPSTATPTTAPASSTNAPPGSSDPSSPGSPTDPGSSSSTCSSTPSDSATNSTSPAVTPADTAGTATDSANPSTSSDAAGANTATDADPGDSGTGTGTGTTSSSPSCD